MTLPSTNSVSTSFLIDLSTIDKKLDKLRKYFTNCDIDLKNHISPDSGVISGLNFLNPDVTYKTLRQDLAYRRYKEDLANLIYKVYTGRGPEISTNLQNLKIASEEDLVSFFTPDFSLPRDEFGSQFDRAAAVNTDPNNLVSQFFNIKPYKYLQVDILSPQEFDLYTSSVNSSLNAEKASFLLKEISNITLAYLPQFGQSKGNSQDYWIEVSTQINKYNINLQNYNEYITIANTVGVNELAQNTFLQGLKQTRADLYSKVTTANNSRVIEDAKIAILDFYIKNELKNLAENSQGKSFELDSFKSAYRSYNFYEKKFNGADFNTEPNQLVFKLSYYRELPKKINEEKKKELSDTIVEFSTKSRTSIGTPLSDSKQTNNRFVALLTATDFMGKKKGKFFDPTILAILSDIDYIDSHIKEVDWAFCPTPDSLNPQTKVSFEKWREQNGMQGKKAASAALGVIRSTPATEDVAAGEIKELVESDNSFNYYIFPDLYFIPNVGIGPIGFFKDLNHNVSTLSVAEEILKQHSKFYYEDGYDTPSVKIYRDQAARKYFENTIKQNGFFGSVPYSYNMFSDPFNFQQVVDKISALGDKAIEPLMQLLTAKVNIACLLSEFRECFFPKTTSCREVLKSFRFSDLEDIVKRVFPETAYPGIFDAIARVKSEQIREERERILLEDIRTLEENLKDNRRRFIIFQQLDLRVEPGFALSEADRTMGILGSDLTLEEELQAKLKEYKDLKTSQELLMNEEEKKEQEKLLIDNFLDMLEEDFGINTDLICNITDLFNFSWMFFDFPWPQFPSFDFFFDLKLTFDLSIIKLILDFFISLLMKLLSYLADCDAVKDLINAGTTEIAALAMGVESKSVINQMANGTFDIDQFVQDNPTIDPETYISQIYNIIENNITGAITLTQESSLTVSSGGTPLFANMSNPEGDFASITAKSKTVMLLRDKKGEAEKQKTNEEIRIKLGGLIKTLSSEMQPDSFLKLFTGKASDEEELYVVSFINNQNDIFLQSLFGTGDEQIRANIRSFFKNLGAVSGMGEIFGQLQAAATSYSGKLIKRNSRTDIFCEIPTDTTVVTGTPTTPFTPILPNPNDGLYAGLIQDLYKTTPEKIKQELEDRLFKPLLIGMLPNGGMIPALDASNKRLLKGTLKPSTDKFRTSVKNFYNNLTLAKKYNKKVYQYNVSDDDEQKQVDNPEYQELIKNGGFKDGEQPSDVGGDSGGKRGKYIEVPSTRYVACGVFKENFSKINEQMNLQNQGNQYTFSIDGTYKYTSDTIQNFYNSQGFIRNEWKISSTQDQTKNLYQIFERKPNDSYEEIFTFDAVSGSEDSLQNFTSYKQQYSTILKDSILRAIEDLNQQSSLSLNSFVDEAYEYFLKSNLQLITEKINDDNLLKEMPEIPQEDLLVQIKEGINSIMPNFSEQNQSQKLGIESPMVDVAMKYINFHPSATEAQKKSDLEPNLFGTSEITDIILRIMSKRDNETISLKSIEQMLADDDNTLLLSAIDGLILALIRTLCSEISMRSLFVLRTFKFDKKLLKDLLIPTYVGEELYKIILKYSSVLNSRRNAYNSVFFEHLDYLHDFIFQQKMSNNEDEYLFSEIKKLKKMNDSMEIDKEILIRYKNRVGTTAQNLNNEYEAKIDHTIKCLRQEIAKNIIIIQKLQLRNLSLNELTVIFDKLSYITSTNDKVLEALGEGCKSDNREFDNAFLDQFILDTLFDQRLKSVFDLNTPSDSEMTIGDLLNSQKDKYSKPFSFFLEEYIYVPELKNEINFDYPFVYDIIKINNIRGYVSVEGFFNLVTWLLDRQYISLEEAKNFNIFFNSSFKYGIRLCFINNNIPHISTTIVYDNTNNLKQNIEKLKQEGKHFIRMGENRIPIKPLDDSGFLVSEYEKTYCIPYYIPETTNTEPDRIQEPAKLGMINVFPIISKEISFSNELFIESSYFSAEDGFNVGYLTYDRSKINQFRNNLKQQFLCDPNFSSINAIYSQRNLLSNMLILSSIYTLGSGQIKEQFNDTKFSLLRAINIKIESLNQVNNLDELFDFVEMDQKMILENIGSAAKLALRAAVQVLSYYCYTTDPNISTAMIIRQAIQLSLSIASQVGNVMGNDSIPTQLPYPLNTLAPYAIGQLPINIFGPIPAGIGIGPPITIPGIILLGLEFILLSTDFFAQLDSTSDNLIKEQIKQLCIDLEGYKKYGIE